MTKPKPWATPFPLCVTLPSVPAGEDHRGDPGDAPSSSCKVALCLGRASDVKAYLRQLLQST